MRKLLRYWWLGFVGLFGIGFAIAQNAGWPPPAGSQAILCVFNTVAPVLTNGQVGFVNCDDAGQLKTTASLSASALSVTVTNTVASPAVVTCANCSTGSFSADAVTIVNSLASPANTLDANSAALLSAVQSAVPAGTNAIGTVTVQNSSASNPVFSQLVPGTTNGWTSVLLNGLSTTVTTIKSSTGKLAKVYCYNPNSSVAYVQVFNATPSNVTLGTSTPLGSYGIPATNAAGFAMSTLGENYSLAISVAATTTVKGLTAPSTAIDCSVSYN